MSRLDDLLRRVDEPDRPYKLLDEGAQHFTLWKIQIRATFTLDRRMSIRNGARSG